MTKFSNQDRGTNTKMYDEYVKVYRMDNGWAEGNQQYNFRALVRVAEMAGIPLEGKNILDVGCGTGDFVTFLKPYHIKRYVGIDIYTPFLETARKEKPTETFIEGDLLSDSISEIFDYAFCSGALTVKLSIDNYDFLAAMVEKMWGLTTVGLAFNVLTDADTEPDKDLFFYNPERVLEICQDIAPNAVLGAEETPDVAQIHVYMYRDSV